LNVSYNIIIALASKATRKRTNAKMSRSGGSDFKSPNPNDDEIPWMFQVDGRPTQVRDSGGGGGGGGGGGARGGGNLRARDSDVPARGDSDGGGGEEEMVNFEEAHRVISNLFGSGHLLFQKLGGFVESSMVSDSVKEIYFNFKRQFSYGREFSLFILGQLQKAQDDLAESELTCEELLARIAELEAKLEAKARRSEQPVKILEPRPQDREIVQTQGRAVQGHDVQGRVILGRDVETREAGKSFRRIQMDDFAMRMQDNIKPYRDAVSHGVMTVDEFDAHPAVQKCQDALLYAFGMTAEGSGF